MKKNEAKMRKHRSYFLFWAAGIGVLIFIATYAIAMPAIQTVLIACYLLYLGVGLPIWVGYETRRSRAKKAKEKEIKKWGFCGRDRQGAWINYIDYPLVKRASCAEGKRFYSEWLIIHDGLIIVNPGKSEVNVAAKQVDYNFSIRRTYAWDGCTPKLHLFWLALVGTPDWWQRTENVQVFTHEKGIEEKQIFWQQAHHASLVHDALYQYLNSIPIAKIEVDRLFYEMLLNSGMSKPVANIYYYFVRWFGARDVDERVRNENTELEIVAIPWLKTAYATS